MTKITFRLMILNFLLFGYLYCSIINIDINGGGNYTSIQAGISAASDGDTVLVAPGIYPEGIDFLEKEILVASWFYTTGETSYITDTIIDGENMIDDIVTIGYLETEEVVLSGFSIRNMSLMGGKGIYCHGCTSPQIEYCYIQIEQSDGIYVSNGEPVINNCMVTGTGADWGHGIYVTSSDAHIMNCIVTQVYMALAVYYQCDPFIQNCEFISNNCGIHIEGVVFTELDNCLIAESYGTERYAFELDNESFCLLRNCTIAGNTNESGPLYCNQISFSFLANSIVANNNIPATSNNWSHYRYAGCSLDYEIAEDENVMLNTDWNCLLTEVYHLGEGSPGIDTAIEEFDYREDVGNFTVEYYGGISFNIENYNGTRPDRGYQESELPAPLHAYFYVEENNICVSSPLQFHNFSTGEIIDWQWDFDNDGIIDSDEQNPVHYYDEEGLYSASLQVADENGNDQYLAIDLINITPHRVYNLSQDTWHSEISQGINYACDGDTLIVTEGVYSEHLDFHGRSLHLWSEFLESGFTSDIRNTIIEPLSSIIIDDDIDVFEITGFTIRNCPEDVIRIRDGVNGKVSYCYFENNTGNSSSDGGAFNILDAGEIEIDHCCIRANDYTYGGFINILQDSQVKISNTEITQNTGVNCESAVNCGYNSIVQITNCSIADNQGWGIRPNNCELLLLNTIIFNSEDGAIYNNHSADFLIFNCDIEAFEDLSVYDDLEADEFGIVIDTEPGFTDPNAFDYTLTDSSACIDAGTSYFEYNGIIYLDLNEDQYHGCAPDIGAYENEHVGSGEENIITPQLNMINFPNPFNPETTIQFDLSAQEIVELKIYNIKGELVKDLINDLYPAGLHKVIWQGTNQRGTACASGIYLAHLSSTRNNLTRRIVLLR